MQEDELKRITMESIKQSFPNNTIVEKKGQNTDYSHLFEDNKCRIDIEYYFEEDKEKNKYVLDLVYSAQKEDKQLKELVSFFGSDMAISIQGAIDEFSNIDKPIIDYYFSDTPVNSEKDIHYFETVYYNPMQQPIQIQGWKIIMSKQKKLIDNEKEYLLGEETNDILNSLFRSISQALLPNPTTYLIKSWITRHKTKGMWSDCRVNTHNWEDGINLLYDFAEKWDMNAEEISIKQNILLIPSEISELKKGDELLAKVKSQTDEMNRKLNEHLANSEKKKEKVIKKKKKWWQF